jgi:hypothetical protein
MGIYNVPSHYDRHIVEEINCIEAQKLLSVFRCKVYIFLARVVTRRKYCVCSHLMKNMKILLILTNNLRLSAVTF